MILSNPQAFFGLRANVTPTAPNVRNDNEVGVAAAGLALTGGNVAYSLRAKLAEDDKLELDVLTGDASGSTLTDIAETMTITGSLTHNGTSAVTFPVLPWNAAADSWGDFPEGSTTPGSQPHELREVEGESYKWLLIQRGPNQAVWTSTADVATPDLVPTGAWHETSNPDAWKPADSATGTPVATAGPPLGFVTGGTGLDIYGETLPTIADVQGILIQCIAGAADIEVNGNELKQVTAGDTRCAFNVAGMPSYADTLEAIATAAGTIIEITIIGKTA